MHLFDGKHDKMMIQNRCLNSLKGVEKKIPLADHVMKIYNYDRKVIIF